jgi:hypothetical protein
MSNAITMCLSGKETWIKVTILWNQQVQTDPTNPNNMPDIIIYCNKNRAFVLMDVAVSVDRNLIKN